MFGYFKKTDEMINLIDVGAVGGLQSPWKENQKYLNSVLTFDPNVKSQTLGKKWPDIIHYNCAVFNEQGIRPFYLCNKRTCSSLYKPNSEYAKKYCKIINKDPAIFDVEKVIEVKCCCLDDIIGKHDIQFDFLKTDAQGADLEVIKSLGKYLDQDIVGIQAEFRLQPLYEGAALFAEADAFLRSHDFYLMRSLRRRKNPFEDDFLYIRRDKTKKKQIRLIKKLYKIR